MRRPCEWSQGAEGFSRLVIKPGLQWWECQILTARPQGPAILEDLSPCFFEEEFCKEMEGSEASKVFIRSRVCVKRTHGLRIVLLERFSRFHLANHLVHCPYLVWLRALLSASVHLLAKMDSGERASGRLAGHTMGCHSLSFLTPEDLFCTCVV